MKEFRTNKKKKTGKYIASLAILVVKEFFPGELLNLLLAFVCDSASNMRAAFKILYAALPSVPYFGCFTHKLNWVFKDIVVVPWVQRLLRQCKRVIHVFRRHQRIRVAFVEIAGLVILKHGDTRHGTWYIVIHRILEVKHKLQEFTSSPIFEEESKVSSKRALYKDVRRLLVAQEGIYRHISTHFCLTVKDSSCLCDQYSQL